MDSCSAWLRARPGLQVRLELEENFHDLHGAVPASAVDCGSCDRQPRASNLQEPQQAAVLRSSDLPEEHIHLYDCSLPQVTHQVPAGSCMGVSFVREKKCQNVWLGLDSSCPAPDTEAVITSNQSNNSQV